MQLQKFKHFFIIAFLLCMFMLINQQYSVLTYAKNYLIKSTIQFTRQQNYKINPPASSVTYNELMSQIDSQRVKYAHAYKAAQSEDEKASIINDASSYFVASITRLLPYWYGTKWDFNGTSTTPQQGEIACGYYVTTVLEDSGLKIERNYLAQQASEHIIQSLTSEKHIKRFSNKPFNDFIDSIETWGKGLYIVGLDFHVGYIWHDGREIHFIHSSVYPFKGVVAEQAKYSNTLANSKYRVLGKISEDAELIKKWLHGSKIATISVK